jgi:hypothetical protein
MASLFMSKSGSTSVVPEAVCAPMADVGVGGVAGLRAEDLLKDQHVASLKIGEGSGERGFSRALRQAAVRVAPSIDLHGILFGEKLGVLHGLEDHDAGVERGPFVARGHFERGGHAGRAGVEACEGAIEESGSGDGNLDPAACIAAFADEIIDQAGVAAQRYATARGEQIGLGGDGVLPVTQLIGGVCHQFGEHDADVGFARRSPGGEKLVHSVEHDLAEGGIVLGQIVDRRRRRQIGRAVRRDRRAVEIGAALDLERESNFGELRVESG